jgi:hypothetical protein
MTHETSERLKKIVRKIRRPTMLLFGAVRLGAVMVP